MDLYEYTYDLVRQIPSGMVSSYGAVAESLGDKRASRAVGRMMNQNPNPDTMPCFKIVYSDGGIGGFGRGINDKIRRLKEDNISVKNNKIEHFEKVFFDDFKTEYPLRFLRKKQLKQASSKNNQELQYFCVGVFSVRFGSVSTRNRKPRVTLFAEQIVPLRSSC